MERKRTSLLTWLCVIGIGAVFLVIFQVGFTNHLATHGIPPGLRRLHTRLFGKHLLRPEESRANIQEARDAYQKIRQR